MKISKDKLKTLCFLIKLNLTETTLAFLDKVWYYGIPVTAMMLLPFAWKYACCLAAGWVLVETISETVDDFKTKEEKHND